MRCSHEQEADSSKGGVERGSPLAQKVHTARHRLAPAREGADNRRLRGSCASLAPRSCPALLLGAGGTALRAKCGSPSALQSLLQSLIHERHPSGAGRRGAAGAVLTSASLRATPACAARSAPQSLPPSPHMPTTKSLSLCMFATATCSTWQLYTQSMKHAHQPDSCLCTHSAQSE